LSPAVLLIAVAVFLWQRGFFASGAMGAIARLTWNANAPKNSVAILPLRNLTGKSELQYICEGFSQDLIYRLTAARDVYVYPMENVMALDENQRTFQRIKANLGAKYLITGAVELAGDSLRVEIEMVETSAGNRVFNEQYTTLPLNRLGIQERVAKEVLYQMAGRSSENVMGIWWSQLSQNPIATDLYQQAYSMTGSNSFDIFFLSKEQRDSSITLLTKALSADSSFVMARVLLAYMLTNYDLDLPDTDSLGKEQAKRKAIESAESVVRLAPDVPETHLCLGAILRNYDQGNHAETELLRAIQLRPTYPAAWYELGWLYSSEAEKKTEASAALNRALQLYEEIGDWRRQSEVLHFIALNYRGMKDNRSAMDYWMKQYELRSKRSTDSFADQIALMFAAYQIAYFSGEDRDYAQGKTYYEIAIDVLSRTLKNKPIPKDRSDPDCQWFAFLIEHQHTLADFEFKLGELPSALKHCQDAQQTINVIGKAIGEDPPDYPEYIEDLPAKIRYLQRDFESAFKCNDSCIEHYSVSHDSTDWSNSLVTRGSIFRAKDEFDSAWACLRDANAIAGGDTTARRTILLQSAITSVQMGDYIRAADSLRFVGAFNDRETNERLRFQFFSGAVASMTGNPDSGLKQMLAANDSTVVYADRVEACRVLAQVLTEVGRHKEARKYLTQGRKLAETAGMKGELKRYDALAAKNGH
jgi:TolB-like protein